MFKCCMCNGTSKKVNEETKLNADDTPIGSPKLIEKVVSEISEKVDDDNQSLTKANKLNGDVQRVEKTPSVTSDSSSTPVRANSVIKNWNSCEIPQNGNVDIEENLDPDPINPIENDIEENLDGDPIEKAPEADSSIADDKDSVNFAGDKDSINITGDKDSINFVGDKDSVHFADDKDSINFADDKDSINFAADKDSVYFAGDKDSIHFAGDKDSINVAGDKDSINFAGDKDSINFAGDKDSINFAGDKDSINFAGEKDNINFSGLDKNEVDNVNSDAISVVKTNLSDTSGYIEKITDGPEDEGDDSVFEACSSENETIKEPAVPIPSWQLEEDDGEYGSEGCSGMQEPPATPVARDELALRRHRFFSDLLQAAQISTEHRVRFDPLGPMVHTGCENKEEHLEELVNRLENVTKRLENISSVHGATQTQDIAVQTCTSFSKEPTPAASLSEEDFSILSASHLNQQTISDQPANMSVAAYENLLSGSVKEYVDISQKIGGDVAEHSKLVEKVFKMQLEFIKMAEKRQRPEVQAEFIKLLGPMSGEIATIQKFRESKRCSTFFNHLSAVSESIPALGWVAMNPTPAPFVKEMNDAGQFYTNRVLKEWKEKDKIHKNWCEAWVRTLTDLQQYIRQHHTTGLVWGKSVGGAAPTNVPPPPPPSPPMPYADIAPSALNDDRSALFAQINRGEDITKNLKKVTSDMQTHKNPGLRSGPAPFKAPATTNATVKTVLPANAPIDKPPVFTRDGKKWLVEYHKGQTLTIDNVEMNNVVYMFRCQDSTLTIKGKINSVVMDSCRKSSIVFDSLVSSIEFVNCQSVQMQVLGKVPTISIDKTDGCQMFLNPESLNVELITSKSSEMNVMVPKANGDYSEYPVPEQFKTTISNNGLHTTAVDSLG